MQAAHNKRWDAGQNRFEDIANSPLCVVTHSKTQEVQRHVAREVVQDNV
jgi:hypothetical protein